MNRYKCLACGGNQYTSCDTAQECIYCGHQKLEKMDKLEPEEVIVFIDDSDNIFRPDDIGKTVFLTREEAEKALEVGGMNECKYCCVASKYLGVCENADPRIFITVSGEYLQIFDEEYPGFIDSIKINYCPMCGRKLS